MPSETVLNLHLLRMLISVVFLHLKRLDDCYASGNDASSPPSSGFAAEAAAAAASAAETAPSSSTSFVEDWCSLDSGYATVTDLHGYRHNALVSLTRDGSVWLRLGRDISTFDWSHVRQKQNRVQTSVLDDEMISTLQSISYSSFCVLTDLDLDLHVESGWNPSFVTVFDTTTKETKILSLKNLRDCQVNTTLSLSPDKQSLRCDGEPDLSVCGLRNMPERGQASPAAFLKYVNFELFGPDNWYCTGREGRSWYTFSGSFYHVFLKLASCHKPTDSRSLGNEVKLRSKKDLDPDSIIIPDPTQSALSDSWIRAWQIYAQVISVQHSVYLQVWRQIPTMENQLQLVGQTFVQPSELRFHELALPSDQLLKITQGDILGLYFPQFNPVGWTCVPCASYRQHFLHARNPVDVTTGKTFAFKPATLTEDCPCRQYSMAALFANKTNSKTIDAWTCPSTYSPVGTSVRSTGELKTGDGRPPGNLDAGTDISNEQFPGEPESIFEKKDSAEGAVPIYMILVILACLLVTMLITGSVSYYKAVHS